MFLRFSSKSDVYSSRMNNKDVIFVWNTPLNLCMYTHMCLIDVKIWPYELTETCQNLSCNLVATSIINPLGRIHSTMGLEGYGYYNRGNKWFLLIEL